MSRTTHPRPPVDPDRAVRALRQRPVAEVVIAGACLVDGAARRRGVPRETRERLGLLAAELQDIATELFARETA